MTIHAGSPPALAVEDLSVRFDDFYALDHITSSFEAGKVHAVVGQNGAGKTTFARAVCGLYQPASGSVLLNGEKLAAGDVEGTRRRGVDMVHQSFALPPSSTVAEAFELFLPSKDRVLRRATMVRRWQQVLDEQHVDISATVRVRDLSVEARQTLEIVRVLAGNPRLVILDEPTAVLPPQGVDDLFARVRRMAAEGLTVLMVLHKLAEVFAVADTVTVLRRGQITLPTTPISELTSKDVSTRIVDEESADLLDQVAHVSQVAPEAPVIFELRDVKVPKSGREPGVEGMSLTLRAGEVVGVAGVEGNGQLALAGLLTGLTSPSAGSIWLDGTEVTHTPTIGRRRHGVRAIPFDRNSQGVSASSPIWLNSVIAAVLIGKRRFFSLAALRRRGGVIADRFETSYRSVDQAIGELSGGNVQRAILGRELDDDARVVLAAQPTRGLDIAATALVHRALTGVAERGGAVLVISADLDELRALSDRIVVIRSGKFVADLPPTAKLNEIGAAMIGERDA